MSQPEIIQDWYSRFITKAQKSEPLTGEDLSMVKWLANQVLRQYNLPDTLGSYDALLALAEKSIIERSS